MCLMQTDLPVPDGPEDHRDLVLGDAEVQAAQDAVAAERLVHVDELDRAPTPFDGVAGFPVVVELFGVAAIAGSSGSETTDTCESLVERPGSSGSTCSGRGRRRRSRASRRPRRHRRSARAASSIRSRSKLRRGHLLSPPVAITEALDGGSVMSGYGRKLCVANREPLSFCEGEHAGPYTDGTGRNGSPHRRTPSDPRDVRAAVPL